MSQSSPPVLHHVGIIARDREHAELMIELMGLTVVRRCYVEAYAAECLFCEAIGGAVELIIPDRDSKLASFNQGLGGLHHVAFKVEDLTELQQTLDQKGVDLLEPAPVAAGPLLINFLPPLFSRGVIVEYVQDKPEA